MVVSQNSNDTLEAKNSMSALAPPAARAPCDATDCFHSENLLGVSAEVSCADVLESLRSLIVLIETTKSSR